MKYASVAERIIANSVPSDELLHDGTPCWVWLGAVQANGTPKEAHEARCMAKKNLHTFNPVQR